MFSISKKMETFGILQGFQKSNSHSQLTAEYVTQNNYGADFSEFLPSLVCAGEIETKQIFSKVSSQLNLLYKITMELTFENVYLRPTLVRAGEIETKQKFSKVSSLLTAGYKIPTELIWEFLSSSHSCACGWNRDFSSGLVAGGKVKILQKFRNSRNSQKSAQESFSKRFAWYGCRGTGRNSENSQKSAP